MRIDEIKNGLESEIQSALSMIGADPGEIPDIKWIRHEAAVLRRLKNPVQIFRILGLKEIPKLQDGSNVGQHWTESWHALANHDNVYVPSGTRLFVLHGIVHHSEVDIPMSIAYRSLFPSEHELFLDKDAVIFLAGISEYPSDEYLTTPDGHYVGYGLRVTV